MHLLAFDFTISKLKDSRISLLIYFCSWYYYEQVLCFKSLLLVDEIHNDNEIEISWWFPEVIHEPSLRASLISKSKPGFLYIITLQ